MATPFIDSLSDEERAFVVANSRGENRPSYYDASIAAAARATGNSEETGNVQISHDLEAALILMPRPVKSRMRDFLSAAVTVSAVDPVSGANDDFALMTEVLSVRKTSYGQVNRDSGATGLDYAAARAAVLADIEQRARAGATDSVTEATGVVIPDLSTMFAALSSAYDDIIRPDDLAVHDRVADAGIVYAMQEAAANRAREIGSWVRIFDLYMNTA